MTISNYDIFARAVTSWLGIGAMIISYFGGGAYADVHEAEQLSGEISSELKNALTEGSWEVTVEQHTEYLGDVDAEYAEYFTHPVRSYSVRAKPPNFFAVFPKQDPERFGMFVRPWIWSNGRNLVLRIEARRNDERLDVFQKGAAPASFLQLLDPDIWEDYPSLQAAIGGGAGRVLFLLDPEQLRDVLVRSKFHGREMIDGTECYVFQDRLKAESDGASISVPLPIKLFLTVAEPHLLRKVTGVAGETETTFHFLDWKIGLSLPDTAFQPRESLDQSRQVESVAKALQSFLAP